MGTPLPGKAVRGSRTGRPIMALLDLLGRRWALRILWELREDGVPTFRQLQERCENVSSSVLAGRVAQLREAGLVEPGAFALTGQGRELLAALAPLQSFAERWARDQVTGAR